MKKTLKSAFALLLAFSLIMSMTGIVMAADSDFVSSHVVFLTTTSKDGTTNYIAAEAFVRNYSSSTSDAILFCAVYEAGGKLAGVSSADGVNTVLKTGYVVIGDGCTAKAFVWEKTNQKIISNIATYGANSLTDASLEIKFDGQSFESYIGEDFSWDKTAYTKALTATDGVVTYPVVTAKLAGYTDNTASVKVVNDFETSKTTTITVEIGQRTETDSTTNVYKSGDNSVAQKVYSKPVTKTFTITYTEPSVTGGITDNAVELASSAYYTPTAQMKYRVSKTYDVDDSAAATQVRIRLKFAKTRYGIIIVKPLNDKTDDKNVIVNSDGTALTFAQDKLYYAGTDADGKPVYGTSDADGSNHYALTAFTDTDLPVYPATMNSNKANNITGTLIKGRKPLESGYHINYLPEDDIGYNYIALAYSDKSDHDLAHEFYVNQDVEVICYSATPATMSDLTEVDKTNKTYKEENSVTSTVVDEYPLVTNATTDPDTGSVAFIAYLKARGVIDDADVVNGTKLTWNAIEEKVNPYMIEKFGSTAKYKALKFKSSFTYDEMVTEGAVAEGVTYSDLADEWQDDITIDSSSIKVIKNLAKAGTNNYEGVARILTPETSMFTNRDGWTKETKAVGGIVSYPEVMELEGSEVIAFHNGLEPTAGSSIELYTFVAGCDAELIYAGTPDKDELVADGWIKLVSSPSENFAYVNKTKETSRWIWYAKKVSKGDKVTIKSNGTATPPVVVARPIN